MIALASTLLLLGAPASPKSVPGPIAVAAFRNLSSDSSLDWLGPGIAETMLTDLKHEGLVRVVERDRVDEAMRELALQAKAAAIEESTAARIGRLVGARTIVVGSYQANDKELRINARFVAVETGEVLDTAKVTGDVAKVFLLQDQVVDRLVGSPAAHPKRKEGAKELEAYHLYAMALTTANDADRSGFLRKSLELDPDFVYAAEALAALQKRMDAYRAENESLIQKQLRDSRKTFDDATAPALSRYSAATTLLTTETTHRMYFTAIDDAKHVVEIGQPVRIDGTDSVRGYGLFVLFNTYSATARPDLALQAGEQYLKEFTAGTYFNVIDAGMKRLIELKQQNDASRKALKEKLASIDARIAALPASAPPIQRENLDYEHCSAGMQGASPVWDVTDDECAGFIARWAGTKSDDAVVAQARAIRAVALSSRGRYREAAALGDAIVRDAPDSPGATMINGIRQTWPVDAP